MDRSEGDSTKAVFNVPFLWFFQDGMLVQEQVIQSLDLNEIDLVKEKDTAASEIASIDNQEETEIERSENEEGKESENLDDNAAIESQIQKMKEPILGQTKGEKTFDRFLDLMEIF